jgi:hypothetical protein
MLRKHGLMTKTKNKHKRLFRKMISAKELDGEREIGTIYS